MYSITWQFETVEPDGDDLFLAWNGSVMQPLGSSEIATVRSGSRRVSYWQRSQLSTRGELALIALDTRDRVGVSTVKIYEIQRTVEPGAIAGLLIVGVCLLRKRLNECSDERH